MNLLTCLGALEKWKLCIKSLRILGKSTKCRKINRPIKIIKQLRMLMLKVKEKVDKLLRIAARAQIIVNHCHLEKKNKGYNLQIELSKIN